MEYNGLASSLTSGATIDMKGTPMTPEMLTGWINYDYLANPPKPIHVYLHPREVKAYEVTAWTRSTWDWPRERKMQSKKWWRRRNKQLWRMRQEEERLMNEARQRYDEEPEASFDPYYKAAMKQVESRMIEGG